MQDLTKLKGLSEWPPVREKIDAAVRDVLGYMDPERVELQMKTLDEMSFPGYTRRRVNYFVDEWERVTAWLFVPDGRDEVPGILCCHQAVPQGKDEPAGVKGDPCLALAQRYAEMGYVTIAPDCATSGERQSHGLQPYDTKSFYKDNPKKSILGKMMQDLCTRCAVRFEARRPGAAGRGRPRPGGHQRSRIGGIRSARAVLYVELWVHAFRGR
jgi:hypothetical protein